MKHIKLTALAAAVVLACSSLAGTFPVYAGEIPVASSTTNLTDDDNLPYGTIGENATWSYDEETETLTLSGNGEIAFTWANGQPLEPIWITRQYRITHLVVEEGITSLEYYDLFYFGYYGLNCDHTIEFPESLTSLGGFSTVLQRSDNVTYYGKRESFVYYLLEDSECFVSTGTAKNPYYPTSGTLADDVSWRYDLDTRYLYIEGSGTLDISYFSEIPFFGRKSTTARIIGKDLTIPAKYYSIDEDKKVNFFMFAFLNEYCYAKPSDYPPIYYYANSSFEEEFDNYLEKYSEIFGVEGPQKTSFPTLHCIEATNIGDVNMDGQINLADVALLQKYTLGLIDAFDTQKLSMDCDGDGDISANDTFVLLQFVMQIIDAFPTSMD